MNNKDCYGDDWAPNKHDSMQFGGSKDRMSSIDYEDNEKQAGRHSEGDEYSDGEPEKLPPGGRNVQEKIEDPLDDITVEACCWEVCYRACPCCIGESDSPFWELWYKHRLQVSR